MKGPIKIEGFGGGGLESAGAASWWRSFLEALKLVSTPHAGPHKIQNCDKERWPTPSLLPTVPTSWMAAWEAKTTPPGFQPSLRSRMRQQSSRRRAVLCRGPGPLL